MAKTTTPLHFPPKWGYHPIPAKHANAWATALYKLTELKIFMPFSASDGHRRICLLDRVNRSEKIAEFMIPGIMRHAQLMLRNQTKIHAAENVS